MSNTIEATGLVNAPVEKVFSYITDLSNMPKWIGPIKPVSGGAGAAKVGTTANVTAHFLNQDVHSELKVTEVQANKTFAYDQLTDPFKGSFQISFEPVLSGFTRVTIAASVAAANPAAAQPLNLERNLQSSIDSLKENLE